MSARLRIAAGLAAALVAIAGAWLLADGDAGAGGSDAGALRWEAKPVAFAAPNLPEDRIVTGKLRNTSLDLLKLDARKDIHVVDEDGDRLDTAAVFTQTYGHGLFAPTRLPEARLPEWERVRIGHAGRLKPGQVLPLTVSWREPEGRTADRIEYPGGSLDVPAIR